MATILTMHFSSSDEEDDNYEAEEDLRKEKKIMNKKKSAKKVENTIKNSIIKEKIEKTYEEINKEYVNLYKHEPSINSKDFLLQFHKKYPQIEKHNNTTNKLLRHLNKYAPNSENVTDTAHMKELKENCRNFNNESDITTIVKNALETIYDDNKVDIEKTYVYAGKTYVIKKKIDKASVTYKKYLKSQNQLKLGGIFKNIDQIVDKMKEKKQINTIDKSTEDWKNFKIANSIDEDELKSKHNFIDNKIFAENVERKVYENKRKMRMG